ncbi:ankyrin repeat-containing protein BDA1-like [Cornus florida]|uniref:ankyrin repeat-containing protein BDA1-like n=1 Tax=Cornus florida TaxID=4283 RepID=UPI00289D8FC4|nr:ankyrin repeat-containing protein BDA1-like [Cornus florida]
MGVKTEVVNGFSQSSDDDLRAVMEAEGIPELEEEDEERENSGVRKFWREDDGDFGVVVVPDLREGELERMQQRLYEAAMEGNTTSLHELLEEDGLVLDRVVLNCFKETALHVAALRGHLDFVKEILARNSELAGEIDTRGMSPLHLASAKGHVEIVKALLLANSEMCHARDRDGRNPLHLAAMRGRVNVLKELVQARSNEARAKLDQGATILHVCVQHNQIEALKLLLESMNDHEFPNCKDEHGNTILHLAVKEKQIETIKYLFSSVRMDVNAINANGFTVLDILEQSQRDVKDFDIGKCLQGAGALRAKDIALASGYENRTIRPNGTPLYVHDQRNVPKSIVPHQGEWLEKKRDALIVVASLIATMAFQAGVSPPGGAWQDNTSPHRAGEAIMAYNYPDSYPIFLRANTIGFVASLSTILLLISGLPFKRRIFMWILMVIMWLTVTAMAVTYVMAIVVVTPIKERPALTDVIKVAVIVWGVLMALLLLGNTIRLLGRAPLSRLGRFIRPQRRSFYSVYVNSNGDREALRNQL